MTITHDYPTENLVRGWTGPQTVTRADNADGEGERVLHGEFARFNEWTEIHSIFEGDFLERIAPGAFDDTIARDLSRVKVLFDHGHDPQLGNKPLGPIRSIEATDTGVAYEVPLIDTDYNRDFVIPAADAGLLGASFRMAVRANEWNDPDEPSEHNPEKLPERTITRVDLFEFGPVTFPAYEGATAALRSRSDEFLEQILTDSDFLVRFIERTSPHVAAERLREARAALDSSGGAPGADGKQGSAPGQPTPTNPNARSVQSAITALTQLSRKK